MDELGVLHANKASMCIDSHLKIGSGWGRVTCLSPQVKYITDRSRLVLFV